MAGLKQSSQIIPLTITFDGGLNTSKSAWSIADNESPRMLNWWYNPDSLLPEVRYGTACQTASAAGSSIRALYTYEKSATVRYIVCAYGSKIYYLSGASLDAWTEIGAIASATVIPEFLTVNSKLLIADGGSNIKTWDGTTYGTISGSPNASCLRLIKQRVACNHTGEPDSVYLSAPNDETTWNTSTTAIGLKAGFGDNMAVNGLEVYGDDLIISKLGKGKKKMYRLNTAELATEYWYVKEFPGNTCAQSERSICTAFNNVYFVDVDGLRSFKGVTEYGDLQADQSGAKVNTFFDELPTCLFIKYIPTLNAVWLSIGSRIISFTVVNGDLKFSEIYFNQGRIDSLCISDNVVYLGAYNGYMYKLDSTVATDETAPDTSTGFTSVISTKRYNLGANDITLRKTAIRYTPKTSGTFTVSVVPENSVSITLESISAGGEGDYLYDATGYLYDATDYLYDAGSAPAIVVNHDRIKSPSIQYEVQSSNMRFGLDAIIAETMVSRGSY